MWGEFAGNGRWQEGESKQSEVPDATPRLSVADLVSQLGHRRNCQARPERIPSSWEHIGSQAQFIARSRFLAPRGLASQDCALDAARIERPLKRARTLHFALDWSPAWSCLSREGDTLSVDEIHPMRFFQALRGTVKPVGHSASSAARLPDHASRMDLLPIEPLCRRFSLSIQLGSGRTLLR